MANLPNHQYAGDARTPLGFGGSGAGHFFIKSDWGTDNLGAGDQQIVFKAAKACYVKNFALRSDDCDSHATPTLEWDVGTQTNDDEFITGLSKTIGEAGGTTLTNTASTGTATEAGFLLAADDQIIVSVRTAAATPQAGSTYLSFDCVLT
jgi:hypothetical protein